MSYKKMTTAISLAFLASALAPAIANAKPITRSAEIDISGLDLTTERGAGILKYRIQDAARRVCGMRDGPQPLGQQRAARQCFDDAVKGAISDLVKQRDVHVSLKPAPQV